MKSLGDFDLSTVIYGKFTTFRPSTGAAYTLAGTPALSVYKDNSVTQSTTGVTLTADFDSVTGLNHFAIDTSADGTFYSAGSFFDVVITTGTVDSVSVVGAVVASFTIRKNSALKPTTAGRTLVVDASGLADANMVKMGPTGSGTAQTARDIGASVLLSAGTGTGQLDFTSGVVKANVTQLLGTAWLTPGTAGTPDVNVKLWNGLTTVALPLVPTVAGRTLDVSATGEAGVDWANVGSPSTSVNLSATTINLVNTATTVTNQLTGSAIATAVWTDTTASDFTTALSIGKSIMNGVSLGTGLTINAYTGNTPQTGDSFARIGATGSGLTSLAPSSTALSTATWTSARAGYLDNINNANLASVPAFPSNFASLAITVGGIVSADLQTIKTQTVTCAGGVTIPAATLASTTNITAGTITTVSGNVNGSVGSVTGAVGSVTAAVSVTGDLSSTMKSSVTAAVWDEAQSGHTTAGTFGKYLDAQVSTVGGGTAASIAAAVWDLSLSGHLTAGSTGYALNAAGSAGDPWSTSLPGSYTGTTAGFIVGTLRASTLNILSPQVTTASTFSVVIGDDYYTADNASLQFSIGSNPSLSGGSVRLLMEADTDGNYISVTGSVSGTNPQVMTFELPTAKTSLLAEGWHGWEVEATLSSGHVRTLVRGRYEALAQVTGTSVP